MTEYKLKDGKTLRVIQDNTPENPRRWDNLGTMICFHRKYSLGDKHDYNHSNYGNWQEMKNDIIKSEDACVILPLYLYDHGGITMNTTGFSCPWDSGQVGWLFISKAKVRKEYNVKRINKKLIELVTSNLKGEVETYDQYLTGDVYGFKVINEEGNEEDSCWGFFGSDVTTNGMLEHVGELA